MDIGILLLEDIKTAVDSLFGGTIDNNLLQLQETRKEFEGDITLVVFPLVRLSKKSPEQTAESIGRFLLDFSKLVSHFNVVKGFLNLTIQSSYWVSILTSASENPGFGFLPETGNSKLVMVEYSSPNTNKPLHLGHIRNNLLGYSLGEILKANGNKVVKTNIVNDRGIHICKSMLAWKKWGNGQTPETTGIKGDHLVGDFYVKYNKAYIRQIEKLYRDLLGGAKNRPLLHVENENKYKYKFKSIQRNSAKIARFLLSSGIDENISLINQVINFVDTLKCSLELKKRFKYLLNYWCKNTALLYQAQLLLRKWERGDEKVHRLWKEMNGWVYKGFDVTYKNLGVGFDKIYYESETYTIGRDEVLRGLKEGIFYQNEDSSVWADLTAENLDQKILLRSDGTSVYITQDIGTAKMRFNDYSIDKMIYVVGNEQNYHFQVLSILLDKLGYKWGKDLYHFSYGMVELPSGKMKSREGKVVDADDLIEEMIDVARKMAAELGKLENLSETEAQETYRKIALGALKYFILKVDPKKNMLFNPEESIDFNGNTGTFIQYTYARIRSVLRKAEEAGISFSILPDLNMELETKEKELLKLIAKFPEVVAEAGNTYSPALIANYCYDLVKEYNQFYHEFSILSADSEGKKIFRLVLSKVVADVVKKGLGLLGIEVPERM